MLSSILSNDAIMYHFKHFDLSIQFLSQLAVVFTVSVLVFFFTVYGMLEDKIKKEKEEMAMDKTKRPRYSKKLGWSISLMNSSLMTLFGTIYFIISSQIRPFSAISFNTNSPYVHVTPDASTFLHGVDNYGVIMCLWFAISNALDLILGQIYYPEHLDMLTGYIHHTIYIWIMLASTTGNGLFLTCIPFHPAFNVCCIEELPTAILAIGSVFPEYRIDVGFGLSFFLLRIVFHMYIVLCGLFSPQVEMVSKVIYVLTATIHVFWFRGWIVSYFFPKKKKVAKQN